MKNVCITPLRETIYTWLEFHKKRGERGRKHQKIMIENLPTLGRDLNIQIQEANRSPNNFNPKLSSLKHIIIQLSNI